MRGLATQYQQAGIRCNFVTLKSHVIEFRLSFCLASAVAKLLFLTLKFVFNQEPLSYYCMSWTVWSLHHIARKADLAEEKLLVIAPMHLEAAVAAGKLNKRNIFQDLIFCSPVISDLKFS